MSARNVTTDQGISRIDPSSSVSSARPSLLGILEQDPGHTSSFDRRSRQPRWPTDALDVGRPGSVEIDAVSEARDDIGVEAVQFVDDSAPVVWQHEFTKLLEHGPETAHHLDA